MDAFAVDRLARTRVEPARQSVVPFPEDRAGSVAAPIRVGMIVPSSNTTMERELPAMLRAREAVAEERFTLHASRVRMRSMTPAELATMNQQAERAVVELGDATPEAVVFACLVAVMAEEAGAHRRLERQLADAGAAAGRRVPVIPVRGRWSRRCASSVPSGWRWWRRTCRR
jgi:hypothetical protein